jgi:hypothetical protein
MTWAKSFREQYAEHFGCDLSTVETDLLRRALHRRALPFGWAIRICMPAFFQMELETLQYLGNARSSEEFRAELDSYRSEYRRHGGILRRVFGVRLSGRRLMDVLVSVLPGQNR